MFGEVLHWSFPSDIGLQEEPQHRKHREPPVLDLLHLEQCKLVWIICQPQWIKWTSRVQLVLQILQRNHLILV